MDRLFAETQTEKEVEKKEVNQALSSAVEVPKRKQANEKNDNAFSFESETFSAKEVSEEPEQKVEESSPTIKELQEKQKAEEASAQSAYLNSLENITVAEFLQREQEKDAKAFEKEKDALIEKLYQPTSVPEQENITAQAESQAAQPKMQQQSAGVIEKPNYDFLEENKKIVKLTRRASEKKKSSKKLSSKAAGIMIACALGASSVVCVANVALIDQMSASYFEIGETYKVNLAKYLKKISNLDATKKSMQFLETYPEDILDAGDVGQFSNWFDRLCNFIAGLFGG